MILSHPKYLLIYKPIVGAVVAFKKIISKSSFDLLLKAINLYKYKHSEEHQTVIFLDKAIQAVFLSLKLLIHQTLSQGAQLPLIT